MSNELLETLADRPHNKKPEDLVQLAPSYIEFNYFDHETNGYKEPALFVTDFVYAARELGYGTIEHTEALTILSEEVAMIERKYQEALITEVHDIFDGPWLLQVPYDSVEEFIDLYKQGQCGEYIYERFEHLLQGRLQDYDENHPLSRTIERIYNQVVDTEIPSRINELIQRYERNPNGFRNRERTVIITPQPVVSEGEK